MIAVSEAFKVISSSPERIVDFRIITNESGTEYSKSDIIEIKIERSVCEGGLSIGNVISAGFEFTIRTSEKLKSGTRVTPYIRFGNGSENTEWLRLGRFYVIKSYTDRGYLYVTAFDKLYNTDRIVGWGGRDDIDRLPFPASMQDMLDYICSLQGLNNAFTCDDYTVETRPVNYTRRELLGFIASCHAGNAVIDNQGNFNIKRFSDVSYEIPVEKCFAQAIDNTEPYKVNGILFASGNDSIYIDSDESDYSDETPGVVHCDNLFASIEIAENVWHELGGLEYYACTVEKRGCAWLECGDVIKIRDLSEPGEPAKTIIVTGQEYTLSCGDGFDEKIRSEAESSEQSSNMNNRKSVSSDSNKKSGGCNCVPLTKLNVRDDGFTAHYGTQKSDYTWTKDTEGRIVKLSTNGITIPITWE